MITTIIITALVSALITLAIGYFIWQFVRVRKLKKQVKDNSMNIQGNAEWIKNVEDESFQSRNELHKLLNKEVDMASDRLSESHTELFDKINNEVNDIYKRQEEIVTDFEKYDDDLHRELDKRFDTMYKKLYEAMNHHLNNNKQ